MKSEHAQCASLIRSDLKNEFKNIKFRVTTSKYANGTSINISWNGLFPTEQQVYDIVSKYQTYQGIDALDNTSWNFIDGLPQVSFIHLSQKKNIDI